MWNTSILNSSLVLDFFSEILTLYFTLYGISYVYNHICINICLSVLLEVRALVELSHLILVKYVA